MTKTQRAALKLAMEALRKEIRLCAFDANASRLVPDPPPHMVKAYEKHRELAQALQTIEEMMRGTQGELGI